MNTAVFVNLTFALLVMSPVTVQCVFPRICGTNLTHLIANMCTYPGMRYPCFRPFHHPDPRMNLRAFIGEYCCLRSCSKAFLEAFCCRSPECLYGCYGDDLMTNF